MLLSAERKRLVCAVRWVECDVRTRYIYVGFLSGQRETTKWNVDFEAHQLQTLVRDWLEGHLNNYMTITPAMMSATGTTKPSHFGLEFD